VTGVQTCALPIYVQSINQSIIAASQCCGIGNGNGGCEAPIQTDYGMQLALGVGCMWASKIWYPEM